MSDVVLRVEDLWKQYRLGLVGSKTLQADMQRWWAAVRGKEDPHLKIGAENTLNQTGDDYVWALQNINLEVKQGEILGVIGKNGAGKSTLLKILSKVTAPTKGKIYVKGRIASLLEVGTGFHPELTGRENIFLNGAILGMKKAEIKSKLDEIVEFAGVSKYLDTPVKRYSSGMYVRLAFAVAAHLEPDILIVDEVLAVGDAEFQKKAIGKMQDVSHGGGRTVLFVSHNMNSIKQLCDKAVILKNGTTDFYGGIEQAIQRYTEIFSENMTRTWENPSSYALSGYIIPKKLYLLSSTNKIITKNISRGDEISVHFEFDIIRLIPNITLGVSIFDENDTHILRSLHTDFDDTLNIKLKEGKNKISCLLPLQLLNEGKYKIVLDGGLYKKSWDLNPFINETPSIMFTLEGNFTFSKYWQNKRDGLIAPVLKWNLEVL